MLPAKLVEACNKVRDLARACGETQLQCGLEISPEDYCREVLKFGLVEVRETGSNKIVILLYDYDS